MGFDNVNINVSGPVQPASTYKTKVLKGNHSFTSQVTEANMKYVIKHDFDLGGESVTIPENCVLEFDGGSLKNGTIIGSTTEFANAGNVLKNIVLGGNFKDNVIYMEWFSNLSDITTLLENLKDNDITLIFPQNSEYTIDNIVTHNSLNLIGNNTRLLFKPGCHLDIDLRNEIEEEINDIDFSELSVNIGDASDFLVGDIVKIISNKHVTDTDFCESQYLAIREISGNKLLFSYTPLNDNVGFLFDFQVTDGLKLYKIERKSVTIKGISIESLEEDLVYQDYALINIIGGMYHSVDCAVRNTNRHGVGFFSSFGYKARAKVEYLVWKSGTPTLIGMGITDKAGGYFTVDVVSGNSQSFTTIYGGFDGEIVRGMSCFGRISGVNASNGFDSHSNAYGLMFSNSNGGGISVRGEHISWSDANVYTSERGVYVYRDSHNPTSKMNFDLNNIRVLKSKNALVCAQAYTNQNVEGNIKNCTFIGIDNAIRLQKVSCIISNAVITGPSNINCCDCIFYNCTFTDENSKISIYTYKEGGVLIASSNVQFVNCIIKAKGMTIDGTVSFSGCEITLTASTMVSGSLSIKDSKIYHTQASAMCSLLNCDVYMKNITIDKQVGGYIFDENSNRNTLGVIQLDNVQIISSVNINVVSYSHANLFKFIMDNVYGNINTIVNNKIYSVQQKVTYPLVALDANKYYKIATIKQYQSAYCVIRYSQNSSPEDYEVLKVLLSYRSGGMVIYSESPLFLEYLKFYCIGGDVYLSTTYSNIYVTVQIDNQYNGLERYDSLDSPTEVTVTYLGHRQRYNFPSSYPNGDTFFSRQFMQLYCRYNGTWVSTDGVNADVKRKGTAAERLAILGSSIYIGFQYMQVDTQENGGTLPLWASVISGDTVTWVNATGTPV